MLAVPRLLSRWLARTRASQAEQRRSQEFQNLRKHAHAIWGLRHWREEARKRRALSMKTLILKDWTSRLRLHRRCLEWRTWSVRRSRNRRLSSMVRRVLQVAQRVLHSWRQLVVCNGLARLRLPRVARLVLKSWQQEIIDSKLIQAAQIAASARRIQTCLHSWHARMSKARKGAKLAELRHQSYSEGLKQLAFGGWREVLRLQASLKAMEPLLIVASQQKFLATHLRIWKRWSDRVQRAVRAHVAVVKRVASTSQRQVIRKWRYAAGLRLLPQLQSLAEARARHQALAMCFVVLASAWLERCRASVQLLDRWPGLRERCAELVGRAEERRRKGFNMWLAWAKEHQHRRKAEAMARNMFRQQQCRRALAHLEARRRRLSRTVAKRQLVADFRTSDVGGLRRLAFGHWSQTVRESVRFRHWSQLADSARFTHLIRLAWGHWSHRSMRSRRARAVAEMVSQAAKQLLQNSFFKAWKDLCQKIVKLREAKGIVSLRAAYNLAERVLQAWAQVARRLAALETRFLLQVDDFRRHVRRKGLATALRAWQSQAALAVQAARLARLKKVFACWRLASQEQVLLRRYLSECSAENFKGLPPCKTSVRPADLERLYRKMAEHRWDVVEITSD